MSFRLILLALLAIAAQAVAAPLTSVPPAEYKPAGAQKAAAPKLALQAGVPAIRIELTTPTAAERATVKQANQQKVAVAGGDKGRPLIVGFGRAVASSQGVLALESLAWQTTAAGSRVARIEIASPSAASLRVALRLSRGDSQVAFRFAGAAPAAPVHGATASDVAAATATLGEFWSPIVDGERMVIEVEAASGASLSGVTLALARVSHIVVGVESLANPRAKYTDDIGHAGLCNIDFKCVQPTAALTNQSKAVAKLGITDRDGRTGTCTGTLLNDSITSFTPYLFSANHCMENALFNGTPAYLMGHMTTFWFWQAVTCNSLAVPTTYVQQSSGASLIARSIDWDWGLVRLNLLPPVGTFFSGWRSDDVATGAVVSDLHHPKGDLLMWSQGTSQGTVGSPPFQGSGTLGGLFTRVVWTSGTTEGGSSGSALLTYNGVGDYYEVRGGLFGGGASCSAPSDPDNFSQLGNMLPLVKQYLTPNAAPTPNQIVVVEFYYPPLNHYFITANPSDIAALDSGQFGPWERTGLTFLAYSSAVAGSSPVCRFYRKPQFGDSHFYSASPQECASVAALYANEWVYESAAVFYIALPNQVTGACPVGTKPIYRYYNAVLVNHRYTTEQTLASELSQTPGWVVEGAGTGPLYPVMCAPAN